MSRNKKLAIILISIISFMVMLILLWFVFDVNSRIDVLIHPERYSFRLNFASHLIQQDYYIGKNIPQWESFYKDLKECEKKYSNNTDEVSLKIIKYNNIAFDIYHDILSTNLNNKNKMSINDYVFLFKNDMGLAEDIITFQDLSTKPEENAILFTELNLRKDAIRAVKDDLEKRKIDANIDMDDVNFENLSPVNIDDKYKPQHIKEFDKIFEKINKNNHKNFDEKLKKCSELADFEERVSCFIQTKNESSSQFWQEIDKLDESWKHRYTVLAIENKKNGDKVQHLYNVHSFKEGNRYYWDIQYYPPNSEYIKAYLEMLKLLMNF